MGGRLSLPPSNDHSHTVNLGGGGIEFLLASILRAHPCQRLELLFVLIPSPTADSQTTIPTLPGSEPVLCTCLTGKWRLRSHSPWVPPSSESSLRSSSRAVSEARFLLGPGPFHVIDLGQSDFLLIQGAV